MEKKPNNSKKIKKCSFGALKVTVAQRNIDLRPILTFPINSPPPNWFRTDWLMNHSDFHEFLRVFNLSDKKGFLGEGWGKQKVHCYGCFFLYVCSSVCLYFFQSDLIY